MSDTADKDTFDAQGLRIPRLGGPRRRKPPGEKLRHHVQILLNDHDYLRLREFETDGVSAFCREAVIEKLDAMERECESQEVEEELEEDDQ